MEENRSLGYAGNLLGEIEEVKKVICVEEEIETKVTTTMSCGMLLTLICC